MARQVTIKVFGYICPPEVDVYADLPEFEPEFLVTVNTYRDDTHEIDDIRYADKTPMSEAEKDFWIDELDQEYIAHKVQDALDDERDY